MVRRDAGSARAWIEIERDDDVRSRRDNRRSSRTFATHSRSTGPQRRIHRVYLLDLSTAAYGAEGEPADRRLGVSPDTGAGPDFPRQHRKRPKLLGHARPWDRPDRAAIWRERFRLGNGGRECGEQRRDNISAYRRGN